MEKSEFLEAGEIVSTHGIRGEVKILPWTDSADFLRRFKTLYISGKPYAVQSSFVHKGCVIAALEARAAGLAVVGRAGTGLGEFVQDGVNGFLCENTPEDIARVIREALLKAAEAGRKARQTIPKPWSDIITDVLDKYQTLIDRRRA